jgi:ribosomal protein L40E
METTGKESFFKFEILIKSFEAFQRLKAIILLLVTLIVTGAVVYGFLTLSKHFAIRGSFGAAGFIVFVGLIIGSIIFLIGYTAAGKILMEYAKNRASIPVIDSIIFSLFSFYRFITAGIILAIIPIIVAIISLVYFFIAKIPDLGKLLAFIGIPAFTIIFSLMFFAILMISFMIAPMIFEGNNIKEIIVKAFKIYKKHATLIFGYFIFIYVVLFIVGALFTVLSLVSLSLTSSVLMATKPTYLFNDMFGGYGYGSPFMGMMGGGPISYLAMFGAFIGFGISIIYMLITSLLSAYMMLGQSYIYLDVTSDMNFDDVEAQFKEVTSKVKSNIDKYKEKASSMSVNNNLNSGENPSKQTPNQPEDNKTEDSVKFCPNCGTRNPADAKFCENCGNKLE